MISPLEHMLPLKDIVTVILRALLSLRLLHVLDVSKRLIPPHENSHFFEKLAFWRCRLGHLTFSSVLLMY